MNSKKEILIRFASDHLDKTFRVDHSGEASTLLQILKESDGLDVYDVDRMCRMEIGEKQDFGQFVEVERLS